MTTRERRRLLSGVAGLDSILGGGFLLFVARTSDSPPPAALDPAPTTASGDATGTSQADAAATTLGPDYATRLALLGAATEPTWGVRPPAGRWRWRRG